MRYNIFLLLDVGTFSALVELLNMEIEYVVHHFVASQEFSVFLENIVSPPRFRWKTGKESLNLKKHQF